MVRVRPINLVLEGGGVKGIGLVGAAMTLSDAGYGCDRIAGTSAGAIVGSLLAACTAANAPVATLADIMRGVQYPKFRDRTLLDHFGPPGEALELLVSGGIFSGDYLHQWLEAELANLGVHTFADLRRPQVPADAPVEQRYRLVVVAADISSHQLVQLPWDYPRFGRDPDTEKVVDAVRASMSIPFFFQPFVLRGRAGTGSSTLVDGGLLWNFPVDIFDTVGPACQVPTIGIKLSADQVAHQAARPAGWGPFGVAVDCVATLLAEHDRYHLDAEGVTARTVFVDTFGVSAVDFSIDATTQDKLFAAGKDAALKFLSTWRDPWGSADPGG
jgi:NTE family protein